jgi:hypothetical protein
MRRTIGVIVVLTFAVLSNGAASAQNSEPCLPQYAAAALIANLQDIALTTAELKLLNGTENPRLRRFLERRLAVAAAEARHHIGQTPAIDALYLPSLADGVSRALSLLAERPLDLAPLEKEHLREKDLQGLQSRNIAVPVENLEFVRDWVARQPWSQRKR